MATNSSLDRTTALAVAYVAARSAILATGPCDVVTLDATATVAARFTVAIALDGLDPIADAYDLNGVLARATCELLTSDVDYERYWAVGDAAYLAGVAALRRVVDTMPARAPSLPSPEAVEALNEAPENPLTEDEFDMLADAVAQGWPSVDEF